jgi:hypothetical protein
MMAIWMGRKGRVASSGMIYLATKVRKDFFFEKKKQKTFTLALSSPGALRLQLGRVPTSQSFLVLFFKKNMLP